MDGGVKLSIVDGIATITFFHPQSNSLPGKVLRALAGSINDMGNDEGVKVIVIQSEGDRAFCAGASFDELINISSIDEGKKFFSGFADVINACRKSSKLIIGRVQGKAVGGGVGLASAVDYCMATKFAAVKLSELAIGIGPFVVGPAVERKLGLSGMSQMSIQPDVWYDAYWAETHGLYAEVFESIEQLDKGVNTLAHKLSQYNPDAMKELKSTFWRGTGDWDRLLLERAEISGKLVLSGFTREAINRFKAK